MHSFVKSSFIALTLVQSHHSVRACEGACIIDTTKAFISNYSTHHIEPVFNSLSELIHSKILYDRPIGEVRALISPISHHWHETIYAQTEKAIFPDYFHGKCQRVIDGVYKHPVGCPNPDCPVVCGTPGSMVHFYDKLVSIVFNTMQKSLHASLPTEGMAYNRLEQAVRSLASSTRRRSSLFARSNVNESYHDEDSMPPPPGFSTTGGKLHAVSHLPMRKNAQGQLEMIPSKRSSVPLDLPNLPVDLFKSNGESGEEILPVDPTTLLGRSVLPIDPSTLLSEGVVPVVPTSLLGPSTLPVNLAHLRSSLLAGSSLPLSPTGLLSRSTLPIDPTQALGSLPLSPAENDSVFHILESVTGQEHLPVDTSKVLSTENLPISALRPRDLPVDPNVLKILPIDQNLGSPYSNEVVAKVDELQRGDLTPLPSVDRLVAVRSEPSSLRFRRVVRSSLVGDDEKDDDESSASEDDGENDSPSEPVDEPASDDPPEESSPEQSPDEEATEDQDESPVPTIDDNVQHTPRRFHRRQGLGLPRLTGLDRLTVPAISKRRLPRMTDDHITLLLKQIIERCNGQFVASCGAKLEKIFDFQFW